MGGRRRQLMCGERDGEGRGLFRKENPRRLDRMAAGCSRGVGSPLGNTGAARRASERARVVGGLRGQCGRAYWGLVRTAWGWTWAQGDEMASLWVASKLVYHNSEENGEQGWVSCRSPNGRVGVKQSRNGMANDDSWADDGPSESVGRAGSAAADWVATCCSEK